MAAPSRDPALADASFEGPDDGLDLGALLSSLKGRWPSLLATTLLAGAVGYGASFAVTPTFQSTNTFLPPQQQQGGAAGALASLGALSGLLGGGAGLKTPSDQYVALMQSVTVSDRLIRKFDLLKVYDVDLMQDARKKLLKRAQITVGKKDGLIRVEVEDDNAQRAAAMANEYVEELRLMTSRLAVTEAQQRRLFFERMLEETKGHLVAAQIGLEGSGFGAGALKAEPKAAAESYAKLRAELTLAKVRLQVLRGSLADTAPEVVQQLATVQALGGQVGQLESSQSGDHGGPDYVGKYREFKYQETLFDLFARQYELARVDESREGALIQVVDEAVPAERKFGPRRSIFAGVAALLGLLLASAFFAMRKGSAEAGYRPA